MKEEDLKKEFSSLCWGLSKINNKWDFWWKLLEKEDEEYKLLKEKMLKLVNLLNNNDKELLEMDIENEIWNIL